MIVQNTEENEEKTFDEDQFFENLGDDLVDPDADIGNENEKPLDLSESVQRQLIKAIVTDKSFLSFAAANQSDKSFVSIAHRDIVRCAIDYYRQYDHCPTWGVIAETMRTKWAEATDKLSRDCELCTISEYVEIVDPDAWLKHMLAAQTQQAKAAKAMQEWMKPEDRDLGKLVEKLTTIKQVANFGTSAETGIDMRDPDDWVPDVMDWTIYKRLPDKGIVLLYGETGSYKSFICLDLALHIVTGRNWMGYETHQKRVHYICAESGNSAKYRIEGWKRHHDVDRLNGQMIVTPHPIIVNNEEKYAEYINAIKASGNDFGVVIIDTLDRNMDGIETDLADMKTFLAAVDKLQRELDCLVIIVHHTGKDKSRGAKGDNRLANAADAIYYIEKKADRTCRMSCQKMKEGEDDFFFNLRAEVIETQYIDRQGFPITSLIMSKDLETAVATPEDVQTPPKSILKYLDDSGREISAIMSLYGENRTPTRNKLVEAIEAGQVETVGSGKKGDPLLYRLTTTGKVMKDAGGHPQNAV